MNLLVSLILATVLGSSDDVSKILECADQAGQSLKTLKAELKQKKTYRYFPDEEESTEGVLFYKRPLTVLKISSPAPRTIWIDKDSVEIYTPSTRQLERWERAKEGEKAPSPFSLTINKQALETEYAISLSSATDGAYILHLEPKPGSKAAELFQSRTITLRQSDCLPSSYEFVEESGDKTLMELHHFTPDGEIKKKDLRRTYPADVEIIPLNELSLQ
ncbi:outer membrane lipoprotein carrier protein LolA [Acidobacteriota bacterium]